MNDELSTAIHASIAANVTEQMNKCTLSEREEPVSAVSVGVGFGLGVTYRETQKPLSPIVGPTDDVVVVLEVSLCDDLGLA